MEDSRKLGHSGIGSRSGVAPSVGGLQPARIKSPQALAEWPSSELNSKYLELASWLHSACAQLQSQLQIIPKSARTAVCESC